MRRYLLCALRLWLAILILAAIPAQGRAAVRAYLVIRSIPVGSLPDALVVDAAMHRLFVANSGPQVLSTTQQSSTAPQLAYRNSPGSVSVINILTNQVVATLLTDVWPLQMVLDAHRQRLYVLCADALPIHLSQATGLPAPMKPTLDIFDSRTLRLLARWRVPGVLPLNPSLPFYPPQVLTFDPTSNHLLVQAFNESGLSKPASVAAYLYDAISLHLLRTYPAPHPLTEAFFAAQSAAAPLLMYVEYRALATSPASTALVGHPRLIQLANGASTRLRDVTLFRPWGGPLPYRGKYVSWQGEDGKDISWSGEIRGMYADSTITRLLVLTAYAGDDQDIPGPPYTLGVYDLQTGTMLQRLVFASAPPRGQQAVAFDAHLGRYYALGTAPGLTHPRPCAAANNIVTGDLRTGKILHTTSGKGWLTVVLTDPSRHLVYAASGDGVAEGPVYRCVPVAGAIEQQAAPGVLQVIDGRSGATLATATLPTHGAVPPAQPPRVDGAVAVMALDPTTGTVYAVDGHGGNAVYVISLKHS